MKSAALALALTLTFSVVCFAQTRDASTNAEASARAQQLLAQVRASLGGEANLKQVRGLSLSGKYRRPGPTTEITGEIKIDLLAPDKFLKTEESNPQPLIFVTLLQAVNGDQVWVDRHVRRPDRDDGSAEIARGRSAMPSQIANSTAGYVVSADGTTQTGAAKPEDLEEIAVQLYFSDYRNVNGVMLPFLIIRAINGAPVDEWKIEKYKVNPDLKAKKFEKK